MKGKILEPAWAILISGATGASSFSIGYHIFSASEWPSYTFTAQPHLTFSAARTNMEKFISEISSERDQKISLSQVPLPGSTMVWSHPKDHHFWKTRSEYLKTTSNSSIPHEIDKLQNWCNLHMSIKLYVKKEGEKPKFKLSIDDREYVDAVSKIAALSDVKNNCARLVTVEEFHEGNMLSKNTAEWTSGGCDELAKKYYSEHNAKNFSKCLTKSRN